MVKQDPAQAKAVSALIRKLVKRFKPEPPPATDPVVQLALSFLTWNTSTRKGEEAYDRLMISTQLAAVDSAGIITISGSNPASWIPTRAIQTPASPAPTVK